MRTALSSGATDNRVSILVIRRLRSNDANGNENVQKTIGFISKITTYHAFCTFLFPFLHDYDAKMHNFAFYGVRKKATTKFYFSC